MDHSPPTSPTAGPVPCNPSSAEPAQIPQVQAVQPLGWLSVPAMRYPDEYLWFILLSSMDIILTWIILSRGGTEVNPLAAVVIHAWALPGAIMFKFSLVLLVIIICEVVGRLNDRTARLLAQLAVLVSTLPVVYSAGLLIAHAARSAG